MITAHKNTQVKIQIDESLPVLTRTL